MPHRSRRRRWEVLAHHALDGDGERISTSTGWVGVGGRLWPAREGGRFLGRVQPQVDELGRPGRPAGRAGVVERSAAYGELIEPELRVRGDDRTGRRALAGLEVDDGDPPVGVQLDAVHRSAQQDVPLADADGRVEPHLGADAPRGRRRADARASAGSGRGACSSLLALALTASGPRRRAGSTPGRPAPSRRRRPGQLTSRQRRPPTRAPRIRSPGPHRAPSSPPASWSRNQRSGQSPIPVSEDAGQRERPIRRVQTGRRTR